MIRKLLFLAAFLLCAGAVRAQTVQCQNANGVWGPCPIVAPVAEAQTVNSKISGGAGTTITNAFGGNTSAGNSILCIAFESAAAVPVITDAQSNTYVVASSSSTAPGYTVALATNITGGTTDTITETVTSGAAAFSCHELKGTVSVGQAWDYVNAQQATSGTLNFAAQSAVLPYEMAFVGVGMNAGTVNATPSIAGVPSSFTVVDQSNTAPSGGSALAVFYSAHANVTNYPTFTQSISLSASETYSAVLVSVKPAAYPVLGTYDTSNNLQVNLKTAVPSGSNIVGKVGIDQTTPGTTNAVQTTNFPSTVDTNSGTKSASTIRVVIATDQPQLTNKLLVTPDSVALPANQSVNVAQVAGTTTDTNSGTKSAGTQRVVLATDQPQLTNKLLVTPDSVALPLHQSVNVDQVNGTTTDTNSGTKSAGTQRVVLATDQPQLTNKLLVTPDPTIPEPSSASGDAVSACNILSAASTNATSCKGSAGNFYGYEIYNTTSTVYYLRLYNTSSAPTCSSATGFIRSIPVPPGSSATTTGGAVSNQIYPTNYGTGIGYCITGGSSSTDNTNAAVGIFGEIRYK